jgi:hypothetical protein
MGFPDSIEHWRTRRELLPDKCTIMLLKGSIQLNDKDEDITETFVGLQTEGSKTLSVKAVAPWFGFPLSIAGISSDCLIARKGHCRQNDRLFKCDQ